MRKVRMSKLKPCPFCGGDAIIDKYPVRGYEPAISFEVRCSVCGQRRANSYFDTVYKSERWARKKAIEAWNERASNWHSGTPTEKGWYILAYRYAFDDAEIEYIVLEWDGVWKDMKVGWDALKVIDLGWQKFDEFKENKSDRRIISESNV